MVLLRRAIKAAEWVSNKSWPMGPVKIFDTLHSACGNGKQVQAQKEEIIHLTQKRLKRDSSPFCKETQK